MTGTAISLEKLTKVYPVGDGSFTALKDINLTFNKGEFAGLIGPSGSGKTTLLNIIGSLDKPTTGSAHVLGKNIGKLSSKESAQLRNEELGFIFQSYNLLPVYSVYENIEFPLLLLNIEKNKRETMVNDALNWVGLMSHKNKRPAQLSGGESQRVAIARAIVKRPTLVLADEPTANLDATNSHAILDLMVKLNEQLQTTFIFATHDEKVMSYLKRKITLLDGTIAEDILK